MSRCVVIAIVLLLCCACTDKTRTRSKTEIKRGTAKTDRVLAAQSNSQKVARRLNKPSLRLDWDVATGKGNAVQKLSSGDLLRICFHCQYKGYTGGLVVGNQDGPGYGLYPKNPLYGFRKINIFCAQDESIWDRDENVEYTYGWSENFGRGDDGIRLEYIRGRIIDSGPERLILQSENAAGCYKVTKVAYTRLDVAWWIIATRITNTCPHTVHFDFFSGDDPWIGTYRSSEGDVGWTPEGLVRTETVREVGRFFEGGFYDLGNKELGQREGSYSNQANFFKLDPIITLPNRAIFANSFAHLNRDIDSKRILNNETLTALNLGWTNQRLAAGEGLTIVFALGVAITGNPGQIPKVPKITEHDWSIWRKYLKEGNVSQGTDGVEFAAEQVDLRFTKDEMHVSGKYYIRNRSSIGSTIGIMYPIDTSSDRPAPSHIDVDGKSIPVKTRDTGYAYGRFSIDIPGHGITSFRVKYRQKFRNKQAVYMVSSALRWPGQMTRAVFTVRYPKSFGDAYISYPITSTRSENGSLEHLLVFQPFVPDRELTVRWK